MSMKDQWRRVVGMYFSPCGATAKAVRMMTGTLAKEYVCEEFELDFTLPEARKGEYVFEEDDLVVFAVPVYAGRVPNVLLKFIDTVKGNSAAAIAVVVYGNRDYGDAVAELCALLTEDGFRVVSAAAVIGEHCMSEVLAQGRPDAQDEILYTEFITKTAEKLSHELEEAWTGFVVAGEYPSKGYYQARDRKGNPIDIKKVRPVTGDACDGCGICVKSCPMGAISAEDPKTYDGICIKCGRCLKLCPKDARYYDSENWIYHIGEVEAQNMERKEPVFFM